MSQRRLFPRGVPDEIIWLAKKGNTKRHYVYFPWASRSDCGRLKFDDSAEFKTKAEVLDMHGLRNLPTPKWFPTLCHHCWASCPPDNAAEYHPPEWPTIITTREEALIAADQWEELGVDWQAKRLRQAC